MSQANTKATRHRVLIVDDEKNMRQTLTHMLEDENYQVRAADSAEVGFAEIDVRRRAGTSSSAWGPTATTWRSGAAAR